MSKELKQALELFLRDFLLLTHICEVIREQIGV